MYKQIKYKMLKSITKSISIVMLVTLLVSLFSFVQIPQFGLEKANAICNKILYA